MFKIKHSRYSPSSLPYAHVASDIFACDFVIVTLDFVITKNSPSKSDLTSDFTRHTVSLHGRTFANISSNNNNNNEPFCGRWGEKRGASLRSSRNKLRPHTRVRSRPRPLARSPVRSLAPRASGFSSIYSLALYRGILPASLPPFLPLFSRTSLGRNFSGMQQYKTSLCTARWYFIVTYINDRRYKKARRKIGAPRTVLHIKAQEFNGAISSSVNDKRRLLRAS